MTRGTNPAYALPTSGHRPGSPEAARAAALEAANINPVTGLATDYLNHFHEPIMLLDLIAVSPGRSREFLAWQPKSYRDHFLASNFAARTLAVDAYDAAPLQYRQRFDTLTDSMVRILTAIQQAMANVRHPASQAELALKGSQWLRPLTMRAAALVQGHIDDDAIDLEPQSEIDIIMKLF